MTTPPAWPAAGWEVSSVGPLVSRQNVEHAVLATVQAHLEPYLQLVEQRNNLRPALRRPPSADCYYGGIDFESFGEPLIPAIIVNAEPMAHGDDRLGSGDYPWTFEVQVAAVVLDETEDATRALADWYGTAIMGAVVQNGSLGGFAGSTRLAEFPRTEWIDVDIRREARSVITFHVMVSSVVNDLDYVLPTGPNWGVVTSTHVDVTVVPDDETITEFDPTSENA